VGTPIIQRRIVGMDKAWSFFLFAVQLVMIPVDGLSAESSSDSLEKASRLVVMIEGELDGAPTLGAGVIFGVQDDRVYAATANHVVRRGSQEAKNLRVKFKKYPDTFVSAELLEHFDADLDLAVIRISDLGKKEMDLSDLDMNFLGKTDSVNRGDGVFPIGYPNGVPWGMPVVPDQIAQIVGKGIAFQSAFISSGHSGGGLVEESGTLIGVIVKDHPPFGLAVDIQEIVRVIQAWGYPVRLSKPATYNISGDWKTVKGPFIALVNLQIQEDSISGGFKILGHRKHMPFTPDQVTSYTGGGQLEGAIKGRAISLSAQGVVYKLWNKGLVESGELISILFTGKLVKDQLILKYLVEFPFLEEFSKGEVFLERKVQ